MEILCKHTHTHTHTQSRLNDKSGCGSVRAVVLSGRALRFLLLLFFPLAGFAQNTGLKTNFLYWATTTPNGGVEWRLSPRYTLSASVGYNAFDFPSSEYTDEGVSKNPKIHHVAVTPELKYWFCRAFERGYVGLHAIWGQYNAGGLSFLPILDEYRYSGWAAGAGVSYGYQWPLGGRWGIEASAGLGYIYLRYDKSNCGTCGRKVGSYSRHWFGPTKAALSLIYYIY